MFDLFKGKPTFIETNKVSENLGIAHSKLMKNIEGCETSGQLDTCRVLNDNWKKLAHVYKIRNFTIIRLEHEADTAIHNKQKTVKI